MNALPSIRARLSRALLVLVVVWGLAISATVWLTVQYEVGELLDDTLRVSSSVLAGLLVGPADALIDGAPPGAGAPTLVGDGEFSWQLIDAGNRVLLRSAHAPEVPFLPQPALGFANVDRWRVLGTAFGPKARVLYVAQTRAERQEARFEIALNVALAALLIAVLGIVWLRRQLRHELETVDAMSQAVARFDPLRAGAPLGPAQRAEFLPVHQAIGDLGQRLARRVANERAFTAHAAHALRTPLAGIDAQLAVALRESPPELQPRLKRVREAAGRLQRVVAALLTLFRSGADLNRQPVDVAALLARLPIEGLDVQVQPHAPLDADPDLLAAALLNLLDNALRCGARQVSVSVADNTVRMQDDGPGVPEERRLAMQSALERQAYDDPVRLGLTLADLVARAHGGVLRLPRTERGFAVELALARPVSRSVSSAGD